MSTILTPLTIHSKSSNESIIHFLIPSLRPLGQKLICYDRQYQKLWEWILTNLCNMNLIKFYSHGKLKNSYKILFFIVICYSFYLRNKREPIHFIRNHTTNKVKRSVINCMQSRHHTSNWDVIQDPSLMFHILNLRTLGHSITFEIFFKGPLTQYVTLKT